ncbi:MAG: hypothetical protein WBA74_09955 [Cyclobacteriaceae bacterium]
MELAEAITALTVSILFIIISVLITRLLGAWMLRINEVIRELKEIRHLLNREKNG